MNYTTLLLTVQKLINNTGREITIERLGSTPLDPNKPWLGEGAPKVVESHKTPATFVPVSAGNSSNLGILILDDEMFKRVEQVALIAHSTFNAEKFHTILDGGIKWKIEMVRTLKPADTAMLYAIGVKR